MTRQSTLLALLLLTGCGLRRVPDAVLEKLPYEARIELLEAENDVALAVDRLDEAHNEVLRTRDQLRRGRDRLKAAEREVGAAQDQTSRTVAELAVAEGEARVEWLRARQRVNVAKEEASEISKTCALAKYETARLAIARKAKLQGSETLEPAAFEQQVKDCEAKLAEHQASEVKTLEQEAQAMRTTWDQTKDALAKKTFDARASPWVE